MKNSETKKQGSAKVGCLTILVIIILIGILASCVSSGGDSNSDSSSDSNAAQQTEQSSEKVQSNSVVDLSAGISKYESGKYHYVTVKDYCKYYAGLKGQKVVMVVKAKQISDTGKEIQASVPDTMHFMSFEFSKEVKNLSKLEGERVCIVGTVAKAEDAILFESPVVKKCSIVAYGDDAKRYAKKKSSKKLKKYFKETQETQSSDSSELSESEYKNQCASYVSEYDTILRNPDSYKNQKCQLTGSVDQIIEGILNTYTLYIVDENGNKWECGYTYKDGESHCLEGDTVTLYGDLDGTETSTTLLGKQVTLPYVSVKYLG